MVWQAADCPELATFQRQLCLLGSTAGRDLASLTPAAEMALMLAGRVANLRQQEVTA
jgi:hypothetical protein